MIKIICAAIGMAAALGFAAPAAADFTDGNFTIVGIQSPLMNCVVEPYDGEPGIGHSVTCQSRQLLGFPGSPLIDPDVPMYQHQATITDAGELEYRDANIPTVGDAYVPRDLTDGEVYHFYGWTIAPTNDGVSFTNDQTGHGMTVAADSNVTQF